MNELDSFNHQSNIPAILYQPEAIKVAEDNRVCLEVAEKMRDRPSGELQQEYFERSRELGSLSVAVMAMACSTPIEETCTTLAEILPSYRQRLDTTIASYSASRDGNARQSGRLILWRAALPALAAYKAFSMYPFTDEIARNMREKFTKETFIAATAALPQALDTYNKHFEIHGTREWASGAQNLTLLALMNCANDADTMFLPALDTDSQRHTGTLVTNTPDGAKLRHMSVRRSRGSGQTYPYQAVFSTMDLGNSRREYGRVSYTWKTANALIREHSRAVDAVTKDRPLQVDDSLSHKRDVFNHVTMRNAVTFDLR